ncbi:hypothetical protein OMO38_14075 [Chryseobacterium sp. 09-1422]|uniref:DUF4325 domain-containing protein n=1 Tax=Chryseobacterium kimseyorum TaxID=2984028 RepID=A0ABT3I0P9_9FLAO|nr:hypothetical protein [Chryseobacterium kimseyorum]MCW3169650.1 hypothetical protein [Chryseobacterium kimseyorum]
MAKIDKNSVLNYRNSDELIDFIAMNRYEAENQDILTNGILKTLPSFVQDVIFIIDFETEFEMQGLFTLLENTTGNYLTKISKSFYNTKNIDISTLISELHTNARRPNRANRKTNNETYFGERILEKCIRNYKRKHKKLPITRILRQAG